ncbi:NAD(P)/FAD-dependent oxidoreductase [Amaricoccus macauensis]|uniref:NAD(P)/FAD-dependent oxidoreductase n=1 Tax=Amaricoccus macauensis TaxID=57001 RepID=UPI003C79809A
MEKGRTGESVDVAVIGAGIFGLSCAYAAVRAGLSVCLLEAERPGAGASGGIVGALSPHLPLGWNEKKQVQLDSLASAEDFWAEIEAVGGASAGYGRIGRYLPIGSETERAKMQAQVEGARENWRGRFCWDLVEASRLPDWLDPMSCPFGAVRETLSARLHPRRAVDALVAALHGSGAELRHPAPVRAVASGRVELDSGAMSADAIVLAAGTGGEALAPGTLGRGVKGQAALLAPRAAPDAMVFADGVYIVPHAHGTVAVGSTSEKVFDDPCGTDGQLDDVIARAARIVPALADAEVLERWAGVRPRGPKPDPVVGPLPGQPGLYLANGGFKTGFGFAPVVGNAMVEMMAGRSHGLPERFLP